MVGCFVLVCVNMLKTYTTQSGRESAAGGFSAFVLSTMEEAAADPCNTVLVQSG